MSKRINNIKLSPMHRCYEELKKIETDGIEVYNLSTAQPSIETDSSYYEALRKIEKSVNGYSDYRGLECLRNEFAKYYNEKIGKNKYKDNNIQITLGASDAIINLLMAICDEGDYVAILEPFFCDYKIYCEMLNINIIYISLEELNKDLNIPNNCKAILFSNPNNPSGYVLNKEEIEIIIDIASKNNIYIISDEVYNELIYEKFISFALMKYEKIIIVDSVSKKFNNCGARIGAIITKNKEILMDISKIYDSRISISNTEQLATTNMLKNRDKIFKCNLDIYREKIEKIEEFLKKQKIIKYKKPKGGVFFLLTLPVRDTNVFSKWLLKTFRKNNKTVLILPTNEFYSNNRKNIRLSITNNINYIIEGLKLLIEAIEEYKREGLE